jgi:hypothetical protein
VLTTAEAIHVVTDLIAKCTDDGHDLPTAIWATLTDPATQARDLLAITAVAIGFCSVALDHTGLGTPEVMEQLRFEATWNELTDQFNDQPGDCDG